LSDLLSEKKGLGLAELSPKDGLSLIMEVRKRRRYRPPKPEPKVKVQKEPSVKELISKLSASQLKAVLSTLIEDTKTNALKTKEAPE
jgi:hypothetical protein